MSKQSWSFAQSGKQYRMGRIFGPDGRTVVLPVDHGTVLGRIDGLEDPVGTLERFANLRADGFLFGPGLAKRTVELFAHRGAQARLLTVDAYMRDGDGGATAVSGRVRLAAALGVDAVKVLMPWDESARDRVAVLRVISEIVEAAEEYGLPVMAEPIVLELERGPEAVALEGDACRIAAEMGVDILKVAYPGDPELLSAWCSELRIPVVMLGGPRGGTTDDLVSFVSDAIGAGASGILIGRNVWQRPTDEAESLLDALYTVVHGEVPAYAAVD
jgi:class I fructose-bisphosphate aldolase